MPPINPDPVGFPTFRPQHPVRLEDMQILWERAAASARMAAEGTDTDLGAGMGLQIGAELLPPGFWARITSNAKSTTVALYSWEEVLDDGTGSGWTVPVTPYSGTQTAFEINGNTKIIVPGPPTAVTGTTSAGGSLATGITYYYVVTATWTNNATGVTGLQSVLSTEVSVLPGGGNNSALIGWTVPATAGAFTLTGFSLWRGTSAGGENVLVTSSLGPAAVSFTDTGSGGTSQVPVVGGTVGPVVWMSPLAVTGFYKFTAAPVTFSGAQLTNNTAASLSIANATFTRVTTAYFNTTVFDTGNPGYAAHVLAGLFNSNNNGTYFLLTANVEWTSNATGERILQIRNNGGLNVMASVSTPAVSADNTDQMVSTIFTTGGGVIRLDFDVYVFQNSGGNLNLISQGASGTLIPSFSIVRLG